MRRPMTVKPRPPPRTMEDVAREAGVSRALVSLVMPREPEGQRRPRVSVSSSPPRRSATGRTRWRAGLASRRRGTVGVLLNELTTRSTPRSWTASTRRPRRPAIASCSEHGRSPPRRRARARSRRFSSYRADGSSLVGPAAADPPNSGRGGAARPRRRRRAGPLGARRLDGERRPVAARLVAGHLSRPGTGSSHTSTAAAEPARDAAPASSAPCETSGWSTTSA